jgi:hypothetical protein
VTPAVVRATMTAMQEGAVGGGSAFRFDGEIPLDARLLLAVGLPPYRTLGLASGCFLFCTRDAFEAVGGFDKTLFGAEDALLSRALGRHGKFIILQGVGDDRWTKAAVLFGAKALRRREELDVWYGERRPDPGAPQNRDRPA